MISPFKFSAEGLTTGESDQDNPEIPESRERRLLELRLLHNFLDRLAQPFKLPQGADVTSAWSEDVPNLAFEHDNLLYSLFSFSATNLLRSDPRNAKLLAARERYQVLALGAQSRALESLTERAADAACFSSLLILLNSFAVLHERTYSPNEPYEPPLQWLILGRGARSVINFLKDEKQNPHSTRVTKVIESPPVIWADPTLFSAENRAAFTSILNQNLPSGEIWDDETREAYEKTLSYIGAIQKSLRIGEPPWAQCKRIICFPMFIPAVFIDFVQEKRPRALVVLGHFFAVVAQVKAVWWLGNAGEQEVREIDSVLPDEWRPQMMWPLVTISNGASRAM
jgi:hypothetical protein